MKQCQVCGTQCENEAPHCHNCGECSFSATAPSPKLEPAPESKSAEQQSFRHGKKGRR